MVCQEWCSEWTCNQPADCGSCAPCQPLPPPPPLLPNAFGVNPFQAPGGWYVNPSLASNLEATATSGEATEEEASTLRRMKAVPSAFWIDNQAKIRGTDRVDTLEGILQDASRKSPHPPLCVFIFYDLPNRDCNAKASNGEIRADDEDEALAALEQYQRGYVDPFAHVLAEYKNVPTVLVIEPDSLGNVISNTGLNGCTEATVRNYKEGVRYAVQTLAEVAPHAAIYVDAAHGGWMGYEPNARKFVSLMMEMGILQHIRGFSTNVANYQSLGLDTLCPEAAFARAGQLVHGATRGVAQWCKDLADPSKRAEPGWEPSAESTACCEFDPCSVLNEGSGGATELSYARTLQEHFVQSAGWRPHFLIDTGRNGAPDTRTTCRSWCNARGAGAGHAPTMNTPIPAVVDAFFWLKTPGESDGCTRTLPSGGSCARFDQDCEGVDSIGGDAMEPRAPEAGAWFTYQAIMLARNAHMRLDAPGVLDAMFGAKSPPPPVPAPPRPPPPPKPPRPSPPPPLPAVEDGDAAEARWQLASPLPPPPPPYKAVPTATVAISEHAASGTMWNGGAVAMGLVVASLAGWLLYTRRRTHASMQGHGRGAVKPAYSRPPAQWDHSAPRRARSAAAAVARCKKRGAAAGRGGLHGGDDVCEPLADNYLTEPPRTASPPRATRSPNRGGAKPGGALKMASDTESRPAARAKKAAEAIKKAAVSVEMDGELD